MFEPLFHNLTEEQKNDAIENIIQHASPRQDFFLMLILSVAMAVFGILLGSTVILIGSMLIAPLLYPLLSLSLGVITSDERLIGRAAYTILKSVAFALLTGFVIAFLFSGASGEAAFPAASAPSLMYALVAAIAGFAAAFAVTKPHLTETLPGVAIAVALVPPLAVAGVGLAHFNWHLISDSLLLFVVNVIGIMFSAMVVFSLLRFAVKKKVTEQAVKAEVKEVKAEVATAKEGAAAAS